MDTNFRDELLALPTPISFIDFETMASTPSPIPGVRSGSIVPVQFSNHILESHGLDWKGKLSHDEFLWTGEWGMTPVYAFVRALHDSVKGSATVMIYTTYERTCLRKCIEMIDSDIAAYNDGIIGDWFKVQDEKGELVPLMSIATETRDMADEILNRMFIYDECRGNDNDGGVTQWLQSPDLHHSNSIKYVLPVAMDEYSGTQNILAYFDEPADGYAGLRREGHIAKGDDCTRRYTMALNRKRSVPFDEGIREQCLRYCCLDTLAMVIIYLAVIEATDRFESGVGKQVSDYVLFHDDGQLHRCIVDGDRKTVAKTDCPSLIYSWDDDMVELRTNNQLSELPIRDYFRLASASLVSQANELDAVARENERIAREAYVPF